MRERNKEQVNESQKKEINKNEEERTFLPRITEEGDRVGRTRFETGIVKPARRSSPGDEWRHLQTR